MLHLFRFFYLLFVARKVIYYLLNNIPIDASTLRITLMNMGCIWIKLGQWISERNDMFNQEYCNELKKLQTFAKEHDFKYTKQIINRTLGLDKIEYIGENIIGCGSIAQTHECRMIDIPERRLIVKVKHPWVSSEMKTDIQIIKFILRVIKCFPNFVKQLNQTILLTDEIESFLDYISTQDDLNIESYHYHIFREKFQKYKEFIVPDIIYSNSEIIIMDYIDGKTYTLTEAESKDKLFTRKIIALYFKMLLFDGILHGDFHGGNIINNTTSTSTSTSSNIGIIDVGLVVRLGKDVSDTFFKLISSLTSGNINELISAIIASSVHTPIITEELLSQIRTDYELFFKSESGNKSISYIEKDFFFNLFGKHGFVLNSKIQHALLSYLLIIGHCSQVYSELLDGMQYLHDMEGTTKKEKRKILEIKRLFEELGKNTGSEYLSEKN